MSVHVYYNYTVAYFLNRFWWSFVSYGSNSFWSCTTRNWIMLLLSEEVESCLSF